MPTPLEALLTRALRERPRRVLARPDKTTAAVLVPLLHSDTMPHLLFTRRAASLPHHQGQVSFPGGTVDPADVDLCATALREAEEEIGLAAAQVRVLGPLDDIETMSSRFVITPFVGIVTPPYTWRPSPAEVDCIFSVGLDVLRNPAMQRTETREFDGQPVAIDLFDIDGHVIWGATHRITRNFLEIVAPAWGE
jgi:8-oxo-dGTP pyrophosphatase MutT (NUDIX family)